MGTDAVHRAMSGLDGRHEHNVLLRAPASRAREFDACVDLLTPVPPPDLNIWSLGITLPPDERLRNWEARREAYPDDFKIISARSLPQEATVERTQDLGLDPTARFVTLPDPRNLTELGVHLTEALEAWEDSGNETVVCFHSITSLLQYVSMERAYQFLHPFASKVREFDATAHYHVNPRAHDDRNLQTLMTLFDGVEDPDGG